MFWRFAKLKLPLKILSFSDASTLIRVGDFYLKNHGSYCCAFDYDVCTIFFSIERTPNRYLGDISTCRGISFFGPGIIFVM